MTALATWPFDQPRNCAVFTLRQIMDGSEPILHVTHDLDDHGWQFLGGTDPTMANALLVAFHSVISKDDSLYELADLKPGWHARRKSAVDPWIREINPSNHE